MLFMYWSIILLFPLKIMFSFTAFPKIWPVTSLRKLGDSMDKKVFEDMNENEQHFFKNILCFFASADALVSENISSSFIDAFKPQVVKACYAFQNYIEIVLNVFYLVEVYTLRQGDKYTDFFN